MAVESEIRRLADAFWAMAGGPAPFPRDLEEPTLWALPVVIVKLPRLGLAPVREWLEQRQLGPHPALLGSDRALHGCLIARNGEGIIFLDGSDPPDELRLSLAHEVAHFLVDYVAPRARVEQQFGQGGLDVLDGRRPPSPEERAIATLLDVSIAPHVHLLDRDGTGSIDRAAVYSAEWRASRLALELLAPARVVWSRLAQRAAPLRGRRLVTALAELLVGEFGLPATAGERYAHDLAGPSAEPTAREWLGLD